MPIVFSRIDDRLLHGQVVTTWVRLHEIEQVIVVCEEVAKDELRQSILRTVAPDGIKVVFFSPEKFIEVSKKTEIKRRTMLLFTNPKEVYDLVEGGVHIPFLNVGNMSKTPENEKITGGVAVTESDRDYFRKLLDKKVEIEIQMVPNYTKEDMSKYI